MGYFITDSISASLFPRQILQRRISRRLKTATPAIPGVEAGHRLYSTTLGRWMSRDPIGERGGWNLYGFVRNEPVRGLDMLGNAEFSFTLPFTKQCGAPRYAEGVHRVGAAWENAFQCAIDVVRDCTLKEIYCKCRRDTNFMGTIYIECGSRRGAPFSERKEFLAGGEVYYNEDPKDRCSTWWRIHWPRTPAVWPQ